MPDICIPIRSRHPFPSGRSATALRGEYVNPTTANQGDFGEIDPAVAVYVVIDNVEVEIGRRNDASGTPTGSSWSPAETTITFNNESSGTRTVWAESKDTTGHDVGRVMATAHPG